MVINSSESVCRPVFKRRCWSAGDNSASCAVIAATRGHQSASHYDCKCRPISPYRRTAALGGLLMRIVRHEFPGVKDTSSHRHRVASVTRLSAASILTGHFEIWAKTWGAECAAGGGRYDGLVKQLGGADRVGIGLPRQERLVLACRRPRDCRCPLACAWSRLAKTGARRVALLRDLRDMVSRRRWNLKPEGLRAQMKRADRRRPGHADCRR